MTVRKEPPTAVTSRFKALRHQNPNNQSSQATAITQCQQWQASEVLSGQFSQTMAITLRAAQDRRRAAGKFSRLFPRLSSKSIDMSTTPILCCIMTTYSHSDVYANSSEDRGGGFRVFWRFSGTPILRAVLYSLSYQELLINDRGQVSTHAAILPSPPGKWTAFPRIPGTFHQANPHPPLIPLTALEAGGRKDQAEGGKSFLPTCLRATPSPTTSCIGAFTESTSIYPRCIMVILSNLSI